MSVNWPESTIEKLIEDGVIITHKDGNHGSNYPRASEFGDEGVPFLTAKLLDDAGNIDLENAPRLSAEKAEGFRFGFIKTNDVLLSHNATVGRVALVPEVNEKILIGTSLTHYRLDETKLLPKYLAAYFSGVPFQNQLASVMSQTTRNQVPITSQRKLSVVIPPIDEQKRIADMLGAFDGKITLNRQINQTLEEMAQGVFRAWFVDFAPTRAKIAAKERGQDPERAAMCAISGKSADALAQLKSENPDDYAQLATTADAFPSAFTTSPLGQIPEGWEAKPLYETAEYVNGGAFKAIDFCDPKEGLPIVKIAELKQGINAGTKYTLKDVKQRHFITNDDVLYSWSGSPETSLEVFKWFGGDGWLNQHIFKLNFSSDKQKYFTYYLLKHMKPILIGTAQDKQTTGLGHVTVADMKRLLVACPCESILNHFKLTIAPMYDQCSINEKENISLTEIRDALLPKLLSGELEVNSEVAA